MGGGVVAEKEQNTKATDTCGSGGAAAYSILRTGYACIVCDYFRRLRRSSLRNEGLVSGGRGWTFTVVFRNDDVHVDKRYRITESRETQQTFLVAYSMRAYTRARIDFFTTNTSYHITMLVLGTSYTDSVSFPSCPAVVANWSVGW